MFISSWLDRLTLPNSEPTGRSRMAIVAPVSANRLISSGSWNCRSFSACEDICSVLWWSFLVTKNAHRMFDINNDKVELLRHSVLLHTKLLQIFDVKMNVTPKAGEDQLFPIIRCLNSLSCFQIQCEVVATYFVIFLLLSKITHSKYSLLSLYNLKRFQKSDWLLTWVAVLALCGTIVAPRADYRHNRQSTIVPHLLRRCNLPLRINLRECPLSIEEYDQIPNHVHSSSEVGTSSGQTVSKWSVVRSGRRSIQ